MKTAEELNALKEEIKALNRKLAELTDEELAQVSGGLYDFDYNIVKKKAIALLSGHLITPDQFIEILQHAYDLKYYDYKEWAMQYAEKLGLKYSDISYEQSPD